MAIVDVNGSSQFSADSQPKLIGLVWGLAATQRSVCIHHIIIISRMPMSNELGELSQWFWSRWPHHEHCCVYYYYYTKNVGSQLVTYFIFHYVFDLRLETWWDLPLKTWDLLAILCCRAARDDWSHWFYDLPLVVISVIVRSTVKWYHVTVTTVMFVTA